MKAAARSHAGMVLIALLLVGSSIMVAGQLCAPETGILQMTSTGQCAPGTMIECWRQSVLQISGSCQALWQPSVSMGLDGACAPNPALLSRMTGSMTGPFRLGSKPLSFTMVAGGPNTLLVRLSGTYAPHGGGQEYVMTGCVLGFQVVRGSVGGIGPGYDSTDTGEGTPSKTADLGFTSQLAERGTNGRSRNRSGSSSSAGHTPNPSLAMALLLALGSAAWLAAI